MSLGERIKELRKTLDLTQQEFADKIGTTRNNIAGYETGRREPSAAAVNLIIAKLNVSETWLRTGEGEMLIPSPNGALDELAQKYGLSSRGKIIIERFLDLKPDVQEAMADYIEKVAAAFRDADPSVPAFALAQLDTAGQERTEPDLAAKVAELERQNQEMAAEIAAMKEEDALLGLTDGFSTSHTESAGSLSPRTKK